MLQYTIEFVNRNCTKWRILSKFGEAYGKSGEGGFVSGGGGNAAERGVDIMAANQSLGEKGAARRAKLVADYILR